MSDLTERQVAQALFALDVMADEWAENTNLRALVRPCCSTDETADKLVGLMKQAWVEGAYAGRISQFTNPQPREPSSIVVALEQISRGSDDPEMRELARKALDEIGHEPSNTP